MAQVLWGVQGVGYSKNWKAHVSAVQRVCAEGEELWEARELSL